LRKRETEGVTRRKEPDYVLFFVILTLLAIGIMMVFSASMVRSVKENGHPYHFLIMQLIWAGIGLSAMFFLMNFDCWRYRSWAPAIFALSVLALILVLIPGIGQERQDARRWLGYGIATVQPAELAKFTIILFLADRLSRKRDGLPNLVRDLGPYLVMLGLVCLLVLAEPDLGTAVGIAGASVIVFYIAGARVSHLVLVGVLSVPALYWAIFSEEYRRNRFLAFLNPWADPVGDGWQIIQSLYALGTGGLFGTGIGFSRQKWSYLPAPHTDFIFAVLGEEMGFCGSLLVLLLFFTFAWRGLRTAMAAPDRYSCLLAAGLTALIMLQALINIGVVSGSLPITGIPLPFISYGGSNLLTTLMACGVILNISRYANR
jgi:cell division protein FtsW